MTELVGTCRFLMSGLANCLLNVETLSEPKPHAHPRSQQTDCASWSTKVTREMAWTKGSCPDEYQDLAPEIYQQVQLAVLIHMSVAPVCVASVNTWIHLTL